MISLLPLKHVTIALVFLTLSIAAANQARYGLNNRAKECPYIEDIMPCICTYEIVLGEERLTLDCTGVSSEEELAAVFQSYFPTTEFYEFKMNASDVVIKLDDEIQGVSFERFTLSPGPFPKLLEVTDQFFNSSADTVDFIRIQASQIQETTFPFASIPSYRNLTKLYLFETNISSIPEIVSDSITNFGVYFSPVTDISPGEKLFEKNWVLNYENKPIFLLEKQ